MTRAEAIRRLESMATDLTGACVEAQSDKVSEYIAMKIQAIDMAIAALKEQDVTDINVGNKWISVREKLPKIGVPVLVTYRNAIDGKMQSDGVAVQIFCKGYWYWWEGSAEDCDQEVRVEITHWMQLPTPPKEDAG